MAKVSPGPAPVGREAFLESVGRLAAKQGRQVEELLGEVLAALHQRQPTPARDRMRPELREWFDEHIRECGHVHEGFVEYDQRKERGRS